MPIDSSTVGANERQIMIVGDPSAASSKLSVGQFHNSDAQGLGASLYSLLQGAVPLLYNGTSFDRQRSATGLTGVPAVNTESSKTTYSCAIIGFLPAATATDFLQLVGSASKTLRLLFLRISGIATAAATVDIQAVKRTAANTGGTAVAQTIAQHDSNDAAASGTVNTYTANPASLGAGVNIRAQKLNLGAAGSAGSILWDFTTRNDKALVLRGTTQSLDLNWNGAAVPSGTSLDIELEWTEE